MRVLVRCVRVCVSVRMCACVCVCVRVSICVVWLDVGVSILLGDMLSSLFVADIAPAQANHSPVILASMFVSALLRGQQCVGGVKLVGINSGGGVETGSGCAGEAMTLLLLRDEAEYFPVRWLLSCRPALL